ncbi:hypothetical protein BGX31_004085 [Mortierella sp. GBA43]|nr:hypothetical protein BGX31_004085 [Mortierella sp. GBA43]
MEIPTTSKAVSKTVAPPKPTTTIPKPKPTTTAELNPPKSSTARDTSVVPTSTQSSGPLVPSPAGTIGSDPSTSSNSSKGSTNTTIIAVGSIVGAIVLFILAVFLCKKRRSHLYAKRDFGYDPSRDPINPNDVLPAETKLRQEMLSQEDSGFRSSPILLPGANQNASPGSRSMDTRMQQREYQPHNNQMPPRLPEIPEIGQQGLPAVAGHAQPGPPPILTNIPMEGSRVQRSIASSQTAMVKIIALLG